MSPIETVSTRARNRAPMSAPMPVAAFLLASVALAGAVASFAQESGVDYERAPEGTRWLTAASGLEIKVLVESSNLGSDELEIAEITFPAGSRGGGHRHEAIEIFYVLSGRMGHVVNGESHVLGPGGVAIVRPGDEVSHQVLSDEPVEALVIWAPGGEVERLAGFLDERPVR